MSEATTTSAPGVDCIVCYRLCSKDPSLRISGDRLASTFMEKLKNPENSNTADACLSDQIHAGSVCVNEPDRHLMCQSCMIDFLKQSTLAACPMCKGPMTGTALMCRETVRVRTLLTAARLRAEAARASLEAHINEFVDTHVQPPTTEPVFWASVAPSVTTALLHREEQRVPSSNAMPVHSVDVSVSTPPMQADVGGDTRNATLRWLRRDSWSPMSSSVNLRGPWPAPLYFADLQKLTEDVLGVRLSRTELSSRTDPAIEELESVVRRQRRAEAFQRDRRRLLDALRYLCRWPPDAEAIQRVEQMRDAAADAAAEETSRRLAMARNPSTTLATGARRLFSSTTATTASQHQATTGRRRTTRPDRSQATTTSRRSSSTAGLAATDATESVLSELEAILNSHDSVSLSNTA